MVCPSCRTAHIICLFFIDFKRRRWFQFSDRSTSVQNLPLLLFLFTFFSWQHFLSFFPFHFLFLLFLLSFHLVHVSLIIVPYRPSFHINKLSTQWCTNLRISAKHPRASHANRRISTTICELASDRRWSSPRVFTINHGNRNTAKGWGRAKANQCVSPIATLY